MENLPLAVLALSYSGLVLFWLAHTLRKLFPPLRAALTAFAISASVHGVTLVAVPPEHVGFAAGLVFIPHLLILPLLLWSARRS